MPRIRHPWSRPNRRDVLKGSAAALAAAYGLRPDWAVAAVPMEFDGAKLWASCDNNCSGRTTTLAVSGGSFKVTATYNRPSTLPNVNLEGFAISPSCVNGKKVVLWSDDDNTSSHALRSGSLNCTV